MKYYRLDAVRYKRIMKRGYHHHGLRLSVIRRKFYSHSLLKDMGLGDGDVKQLTEIAALKRVRFDRHVELSIKYQDMYSDDPEFRKQVLAAGRRSREVISRTCSADEYRRYLKKARRARYKEQKKRRGTLLRRIILPNFGTETSPGKYKKPGSICVMDLVDLIKYTPEYREIAQQYYNMSNHGQFQATVWRDVNNLGIIPLTLQEVAGRISAKLKKRVANDHQYMERLRAVIAQATRARMKLYEERPELKDRSTAASAATRKRKMQEDPEFRKQVLYNLSLGNPAYWNKMRNDPEFRKRQLRKHIRNLDKGRRAVMRMTERRRNALYKYVIEPEFGGIGCRIGQKRLETLLNEKYTGVRDKYYSGAENLRRMLKKDLHRLRQENLQEFQLNPL